MARKSPSYLFAGFGESSLIAGIEPSPAALPLPTRRRAARRLIREHCVPRPGVYGMIDAAGELVYVGKSKSLLHRLSSYFHASDSRTKSRRIIRRTRQVVWEFATDEFAALLRELELIRRWQPRFNVRGRHSRRFRRVFICLDKGPAPYARVVTQMSAKAGSAFGPVLSIRRCQEAVQRLNRWFQFRECPDRTPLVFSAPSRRPQKLSAQCMRYHLGNCLGPCAGLCSQSQYARRVRAARAFLHGSDASLVDRIEQAMLSAAESREFERAAALRDTWNDLRWLAEQLDRLRQARRDYSFVYPLPHDGGETWYVVDHGQVMTAMPAPVDRRTARECLAFLERTYPGDRPRPAGENLEDLDVILLVAAWFRRHPAELDRVLWPVEARRRCQRLAAARPVA
ncbi:MAG: GIY-YIG nuclease family protein [Pirellulales bacterium]